MRTDSGNSELAGDRRRVPSAAAQRGAIVAPREASEPITGTPAHTRALRLSVLRPDPGVVVVRMSGEIDLAAVPRLTELIRQRLTAAVLRAIVLDLSEVTFFNTAGLDMLLHAQRRTECKQISMFVVLGTGPVARMMRLTGLTDRFASRETTAQAVTELRRRS